MGSVRDPGRDAMEAAELERARLSVQQERRQVQARRDRERAMKGDESARRALAKDYAAMNEKERARAQR